MKTNKNRKDINLCEILKTHIGEKFYFPLLGYLVLKNINEPAGQLFFELKDGVMITVKSNGLDEFDQPAVFPNEHNRDWDVFVKTWSQFVKFNNIFKSPLDKAIDLTGSITKGWTRRNTPIEKQCLALMKISTLIDHSYGGHVKPEEWANENQLKYIICPANKEDYKKFYILNVKTHMNFSIIAFHTLDAAQEFITYPENVELLEDYFQYI